MKGTASGATCIVQQPCDRNYQTIDPPSATLLIALREDPYVEQAPVLGISLLGGTHFD